MAPRTESSTSALLRADQCQRTRRGKRTAIESLDDFVSVPEAAAILKVLIRQAREQRARQPRGECAASTPAQRSSGSSGGRPVSVRALDRRLPDRLSGQGPRGADDDEERADQRRGGEVERRVEAVDGGLTHEDWADREAEHAGRRQQGEAPAGGRCDAAEPGEDRRYSRA